MIKQNGHAPACLWYSSVDYEAAAMKYDLEDYVISAIPECLYLFSQSLNRFQHIESRLLNWHDLAIKTCQLKYSYEFSATTGLSRWRDDGHRAVRNYLRHLIRHIAMPACHTDEYSHTPIEREPGADGHGLFFTIYWRLAIISTGSVTAVICLEPPIFRRF